MLFPFSWYLLHLNLSFLFIRTFILSGMIKSTNFIYHFYWWLIRYFNLREINNLPLNFLLQCSLSYLLLLLLFLLLNKHSKSFLLCLLFSLCFLTFLLLSFCKFLSLLLKTLLNFYIFGFLPLFIFLFTTISFCHLNSQFICELLLTCFCSLKCLLVHFYKLVLMPRESDLGGWFKRRCLTVLKNCWG